MTLPLCSQTQPEEDLGLRPLSLVRSALRKRIDQSDLNWQEKQFAYGELDLLVRQEHLKRLRSAVWQWRDERRERANRLMLQRQELVARVFLERQRVRSETFGIRASMVRTRLDLIERMQQLRRREDGENPAKDLRRELIRVTGKAKVDRLKRRILEAEMTDRVLARGRILRKVREEFPDLTEELSDYYDRKQYEEGADE